MTKKVLISIDDWVQIERKIAQYLGVGTNNMKIERIATIFFDWFEKQPEVKDEESTD